MSFHDSAMKMKEQAGAYSEELAMSAATSQTVYLFSMLAKAEESHHDALVELTGNAYPQRSQFKVLHGDACLLKTSPGKA